MLPEIPLHCRWARSPHKARLTLLAASVGLALILVPVASADHAFADTGTSSGDLVQMPSLAPIVAKVQPAVVNISVVEKADTGNQTADNQGTGPGQGMGPGPFPGVPPNSPFGDFLRHFFEQQGINPGMPQPHAQMALGSGFVIDPSGYIVTNNHVVDGAQKVTVTFSDSSKYPARIIGRDPKTDLALLKIDAGKPLPYVSWGNSNSAMVGDWVIAVGEPFGLGGTVSAGIISARGRDIHSGPYDDYLQIDAPINRGNSGGPTFNLKGDVIGINTAIYSPNGGSVGIGFAIPSSLAKPVIEQLREHGKVSRGWLGVEIQQVTPALAKGLGLPKAEGALVAGVTAGGPGEKAGLQQGDVIESFAGHSVEKMRDLPLIVADTPVGTNAEMKVWRHNQEITLQATIAEQPVNSEPMASNNEPGADNSQMASAWGLKLQPLTPDLHKQLGVPEKVKGVVVASISDSSPLAGIDLQPGDVIVSINQQPVATPEDAAAKLKQAESASSKHLLLLVDRHGNEEFVAWSETNQNAG